jgi:hypothetical protein
VWNLVVYGRKYVKRQVVKADIILLYVEGKGGHLLGTRSHIAALEVAFIIEYDFLVDTMFV